MPLPFRPALLALSLGLAVAGCSHGGGHRESTLYLELGGQPGVDQLVERLVQRVHHDPRIAPLFQDSDLADLQRLIGEQFCVEFGGPCEYTGRSMEDAHSGLAITEAEFEAFVEDLILAMEDRQLPITTQNRILAVFAPMRAQVIHQ